MENEELIQAIRKSVFEATGVELPDQAIVLRALRLLHRSQNELIRDIIDEVVKARQRPRK